MRSTMRGLLVALLFVAVPMAARAADTVKPQNAAAVKAVPKPKVPPAAAQEAYKCAAGYTATPASSANPVNEFTCSGEKDQTPACTSTPSADWKAGKSIKKDGKLVYACKRIPG